MPLRIVKKQTPRERQEEQQRRKAGRRKTGPSKAGDTARKPTPSAGPGSLMSKPKKPKYVIITGESYNKARKEVEAEGGSPRLKTEDDKSARVMNKVFGNVRGRDELSYLSGGQAKLDKNKNNKIDAQDFKMLRAEKGKPMKANLGLLAMKKAKDKGAKGMDFLSPMMMAKKLFNKKTGGVMKANKGKMFTSEQKKKFPGLAKAGSVQEYLKRKKEVSGKGKMSFSDKMKAQDQGLINKKTGEGAKDLMKRAKSVTVGKRLLVPIALGIGAVQYLKGKMKDKKEKPKKKMGGGMMQRPMGMGSYKKGTMIKARGGGIARSKPTKLY